MSVDQSFSPALSEGGITLPGMSEGTQAQQDADTALGYAINCVIREDQAPRSGQTADDVIAGYATDLLDQLGAGPDRMYAAARAACIAAADEVAHPGRWRPALRAVELLAVSR